MTSKRKTKKPFLRLIYKCANGFGFFPDTHLDVERVALDYKVNQVYEADLKQPRSLPRLGLYWACLHHVYNNDRFGYASPEKIHDALLVAAGYCSPERRLNGEIVMVPDSIAFANMGEETFRKYFDQALQLIWQHWQIDIDTLLREGKRLNTKVTYFRKPQKDGGVTPTTEKADGRSEAA